MGFAATINAHKATERSKLGAAGGDGGNAATGSGQDLPLSLSPSLSAGLSPMSQMLLLHAAGQAFPGNSFFHRGY
jgi:hypothetical protein